MPKSNVIEYRFEGNILNLEQALNTVGKLLKESTKKYKDAQEGQLTEEQNTSLKKLKSKQKEFKAYVDNQKNLTDEQMREAKALGDYLLRESIKEKNNAIRVEKAKANAIIKEQQKQQNTQAREAKKVANKQLKDDEKLQLLRDQALTPAGKELARVQTEYLQESLKEVGSALSPEAINDITNAIANYQNIINSSTASTEDQADAIINLNDTYKNYDLVLRTIRRTLTSSNKSISSCSDLVNKLRERIEYASKSINTYILIFKRLISLIKEGIPLYADYVESLNFLEIASRDAANEMQRFTNIQALAFGLKPTDVNQTAGVFYALANSFGIVGDEAVLVAQNMTKLAEDMAALYNVELEVMTSKLRSGLAGRTQALQQLGIVVSDTAINEWLLSKNINTTMANMNEASQAAARYAFILENTTTAQGALAKEIETPANQLRIFKTQLEELVKYVGAIGTRIILPLLRIFNYLLQVVNAFLKGISDLSAKSFTKATGDISEGADEATDSVEDLDSAMKGLTGLDEINQSSTDSTEQYGVLNEEIANLLKGYDNLADSMGGFAKFAYSIGEIFGSIFALFNGTSFFTYIGEGLDTVVGWLDKLLGFLDSIRNWFDNAPEWLKTIFSIVQTIFTTLGDGIVTIIAVAAAMSIWKSLMDTKIFSNFISVIKDMAKGVANLIKSIYAKITARKTETIVENENTVATEANVVANNSNAAANAAETIAETADTSATRSNTTATLTNTGATAANTTANMTNAGAGMAAGAGKVAASGAAAPITAALIAGGVGAVLGLIGMIKSMTKMATGGVVSSPTFALIGEGKYNEAVVPLGNSPQFTSMKEDIANEVISALGSRGSRGSNQPIVLNINGRELARTILPDIEYALPQTGMKLRRG